MNQTLAYMKIEVSPMGRLLFALMVILFVSCGENIDEFIPNPTEGNIEDFFDLVEAEPEQVFNVNADQQIIIETKENSVIVIDPENLSTNESLNISGDIVVKVIEISKKSQMLPHRLTTVTKNSFLVSEKMFNIKAFKDDKPIKLKPGKSFKVHVPNALPDPEMKIFYGETIDDNIVWEEDSTNVIRPNEWFFQLDQGVLADFGYVFECADFTWVNIDKYLEEGLMTADVCVELDSTLYNPMNTVVFAFFNDRKTAVAFSAKNDSGNIFCEPYGQIPIDENITIVIVSAQGDDIFHYGEIMITVKGDVILDFTPVPRSLDEIKEALKQL